MKFAINLFLLAVLVFTNTNNLPKVDAFPSGAGDCTANQAAVGAAHITGSETTGYLEDGAFRIKIGETVLSKSNDTTVVSGAYDITVEAIDAATGSFRGYLVRIGNSSNVNVDVGDDIAVLQPNDSMSQTAIVCGATPSLTHISSDDKTIASGSLVVNATDTVLLFDVTVVVTNSGGESEYYYTGYNVRVEEADEPDSDDERTSFFGSILKLADDIFYFFFGWLYDLVGLIYNVVFRRQ